MSDQLVEASFDSLELEPQLLDAIAYEGYTEPTPIQKQAIPIILKGENILATAQTGSGKTAGFILPMLQIVNNKKSTSSQPRALILTPTRELATQIGDSIAAYGKFLEISYAIIIGGVPQREQIRELRSGVDVVVATPGRLMDLMRRKKISLDDISVFILDEADRMIDMGFVEDIQYIQKRFKGKIQTLLFSATMSDELQELATEMVDSPQIIEVDRPASSVDSVVSTVFFIDGNDKYLLLKYMLLNYDMDKVLVFVKTRREVEFIAKKLYKEKLISQNVAYLHGEKDQNYRDLALERFKNGKISILVATDVASRGIDIDDISHVINYHVAEYPEDHIHRVGRTARAGREGFAYTFCSVDERRHLGRIEELMGEEIPQAKSYPYKSRKPLGEYLNPDK